MGARCLWQRRHLLARLRSTPLLNTSAAFLPPQPLLPCRPQITVRYYHDLAVTDGAVLNAFTAGSAMDLSLYAARGPLANLFSDITGAGGRVFGADGSEAAGWGSTFFNLQSPGLDLRAAEGGDGSGGHTAPALPGCEAGDGLNLFLPWAGSDEHSAKCAGWRVAPTNGSLPPDVWEEQRFAHLMTAAAPEGATREVPEASYTACRTYMGSEEVTGGLWARVTAAAASLLLLLLDPMLKRHPSLPPAPGQPGVLVAALRSLHPGLHLPPRHPPRHPGP